MTRSLLLVEDSEDDVFFLQVAMKRLSLPHGLVVARDGREGMRRLEDSMVGLAGAPQFALVLLDLKLPYVGGLEVLAWMQSVPGDPFPPVVVLTTSENQSDALVAYRLGAAAVLVKPNRPEELVELLRLLESKWLTEHPPAAPAGGHGQVRRSANDGVICSTSTRTGIPGAQSALSATNRSR